jgi:hypothetical protein
VSVVTANLLAEYVGKLAKTKSTPGNNTDPTAAWADLKSTHDGTLSGFAYTTASGWAGAGTAGDPYRLKADGVNDYVDCGNVGIGTGKVCTLELWILVSDIADNYYAMSAGNTASDNSDIGIYFNTNQNARFEIYNDAGAVKTVAGTADLNDGNYHHVVAVCDGSTMTLYVDGTSVGTPTAPPASPCTVDHLTLFCANWSANKEFYLNAAIATARVYSACLSGAQVSANYAAGVLAASTDGAAGIGKLVWWLNSFKWHSDWEPRPDRLILPKRLLLPEPSF